MSKPLATTSGNLANPTRLKMLYYNAGQQNSVTPTVSLIPCFLSFLRKQWRLGNSGGESASLVAISLQVMCAFSPNPRDGSSILLS